MAVAVLQPLTPCTMTVPAPAHGSNAQHPGLLLATALALLALSCLGWRRFHCTVLQGITDYCGTFTNVHISWTSTAHDTCIFQNSAQRALVQK